MKPASEKRTRAWAETRFSNFQLANSGNNNPRLVREIQIMRDCDITQVPKMYACKITDSPLGPMLVSVERRVNGKDLFEVLSTVGKPSFNELLSLTHDILLILCEVEKLGIVHRDIKPANILPEFAS